MALPQPYSNSLPDYGVGRRMGLVSADDIDFNALANRLDCMRDFSQVGIIYSDGPQQWLVRPSRRYASQTNSNVSHVVITKTSASTLASAPHTATKALTDTLSKPSLVNEITSTAMSCGAAVATVFLTLGATAAIPVTAGASGIVAGIITAGGIATGMQCFIGASRLFLMESGHEDTVTWFDSLGWYNATITALDIISLAGAGAGLKSFVETYKVMKATTSSGNLINWLKTLSRAERRRITEEIIRQQNPGISNSGIKAAIKAGIYPKRYPSDALQKSLQRELATAFVNSSAFMGSALTGTIRNPHTIPQSGKYLIGVVQSFSVN
ncbi:hypothetical protein RAC90_13050 [Pantoea sp. CS_6]|uniref:hypothetical protein n=1 Tax=Pantoea TaxID=53335 RepID=UPI0024BE3068|nr:hypothetical protein [Pantoea stewartii]WHS98270.1 MAG: hypothetical protein LZT29_01181 [Pantoea stewartii]